MPRNAARTRLTPDDARAAFGELTDPALGTHRVFETPTGLWRPLFDSRHELSGYELQPTRPVRLRTSAGSKLRVYRVLLAFSLTLNVLLIAAIYLYLHFAWIWSIVDTAVGVFF